MLKSGNNAGKLHVVRPQSRWFWHLLALLVTVGKRGHTWSVLVTGSLYVPLNQGSSFIVDRVLWREILNKHVYNIAIHHPSMEYSYLAPKAKQRRFHDPGHLKLILNRASRSPRTSHPSPLRTLRLRLRLARLALHSTPLHSRLRLLRRRLG